MLLLRHNAYDSGAADCYHASTVIMHHEQPLAHASTVIMHHEQPLEELYVSRQILYMSDSVCRLG